MPAPLEISIPEGGEVAAWYVERITTSYEHWTGEPLVRTETSGSALLQRIFQAEFALLAHDTGPDPLINFVNARALQLWEQTWQEFIGMPSRLTAELDQRDDRARVLREVQDHGYSNGYSGIRISRTGRRCRSHQSVVWNVLDDRQERIGQAAMFRQWSYV